MPAAIELLAAQPRPSGAKKLVGGDDAWRVRFGNYRIVYEIRDEVLLVPMVAAGHRRDIYQRPVATVLKATSRSRPGGMPASSR